MYDLKALSRQIINARLRESGIPPRFLEGFAAYDADRAQECAALKARAMEWANAYTPDDPLPGLAMIGQTGVGKTLLAAGIAARLAERDIDLAWINSADLFLRIRSSFGRRDGETEGDLMDLLSEPPVLFLDDLGVERPDAWILERLYNLVSRRYEYRKTLIFTSNYSGKDLLARLNAPATEDLAQRIMSRLAGLCEPIGEFPKTDFRKEEWKRRNGGTENKNPASKAA